MRVKNAIAVALLAFSALFALPLSAAAVGYVPGSSVDVQCTGGQPHPGGTCNVNFVDGSFSGTEQVTGSVTGDPAAGIAVLKMGTTTSTTKSSSATGGITFTVSIPAGSSGSYTVTATGATSHTVGVVTITIVPDDSSKQRSYTGYQLPVFLVWIGGGIIALAVAFLIVLAVSRRRRHSA